MRTLLIFVLFFVLSDAAPLQYTQEMKENLFPDTAITFAKRLTPNQIQIYLNMYEKYRGSSEFMQDEDAQKMLDELKESYPEISKRIQPVIDEVVGKMSSMSTEAKIFFRYYAGRGGNLNSSTDSEISKFLCDVLPRWYALKEETREELHDKYPKIANILNDKYVQKIAGFKE